MKKEFKGFNHGKGQIVFDNYSTITQLKPVEVHLKEDGTLNDGPSLAIVFAFPGLDVATFGQISLEMFNQGLADIGYKIEKI